MTVTTRVRNLALLGLVGFAASFTLGACFNGLESEGLPCDDNSQCAIGMLCTDGFCNGVFFCEDGSSIEASDVCDDFPDCVTGEDEDPDLCASEAEGEEEGEEQFTCEDDSTIPLSALCNETADCPDGEDEEGCAGVGANMCGGSGGDDIAFEPQEAIDRPLPNPMPVRLLDFLGPDTPEVITGGTDSDRLEVISIGDDGNQAFSQIGPYEGQEIVGFDVGDINGDGMGDLVVAAEGAGGFTTYVYQNDAPDGLIEYGTPLELPLLEGLQTPEAQAIKLARLNNDSDLDMIGIVDSPDLGNGLLLVAFGDSGAADGDGAYFTPGLADIVPPLGYNMFFDVAVGDFDDVSPLDDILVAGDLGMMQPGLWLISRTDEGEDAWAAPTMIDVSGTMPVRLAVGTFGPGLGVAVLDPMRGQLEILRKQGMGGMLVSGEVFDFGMTMPEGISMFDINCDSNDDFLLYRGEGVEAYFGDGMGGITNFDDPISFPLESFGRGRIGAADYNGDGIPDIVATMENSVQFGMSTGEAAFGED